MSEVSGFRFVEYTPEWFERVQEGINGNNPAATLGCRDYVDYYYATGDWCRLYLAVDDAGAVVATQGGELMPFQCGPTRVVLCYNNDLLSKRPGAGLYLFRRWMQTAKSRGIAIGGADDFQRIIRFFGWRYFEGVRLYDLNRAYSRNKSDGWFRLAAKNLIDHFRRRNLSGFASRIPAWVSGEISVREEVAFTEDMLPQAAPFTFRFAPSVDYLNWRYNTKLPFVCYRLFRIMSRGCTSGYVVINEFPRRLVVAQCDGNDPATLAYGVLLSILEAGKDDTQPRSVLLISSHSVMRPIFEEFGFRAALEQKPLAIGGMRPDVDLPANTAGWLVNLDWGGRVLRQPFAMRPGTAASVAKVTSPP